MQENDSRAEAKGEKGAQTTRKTGFCMVMRDIQRNMSCFAFGVEGIYSAISIQSVDRSLRKGLLL